MLERRQKQSKGVNVFDRDVNVYGRDVNVYGRDVNVYDRDVHTHSSPKQATMHVRWLSKK